MVEELRLALHEFKQLYNQHWILERHGYRTPAAVRAAYAANCSMISDRRVSREPGPIHSSLLGRMTRISSVLARWARSLSANRNPPIGRVPSAHCAGQCADLFTKAYSFGRGGVRKSDQAQDGHVRRGWAGHCRRCRCPKAWRDGVQLAGSQCSVGGRAHDWAYVRRDPLDCSG